MLVLVCTGVCVGMSVSMCSGVTVSVCIDSVGGVWCESGSNILSPEL